MEKVSNRRLFIWCYSMITVGFLILSLSILLFSVILMNTIPYVLIYLEHPTQIAVPGGMAATFAIVFILGHVFSKRYSSAENIEFYKKLLNYGIGTCTVLLAAFALTLGILTL